MKVVLQAVNQNWQVDGLVNHRAKGPRRNDQGPRRAT